MSSVRERVRLAELVALLSLGTDLGLGQPIEQMIRTCLIALRMGERLGLAESERGVVYYSGLLAWVGCFTCPYVQVQAKWFGDDTTLKGDVHYHYDMGRVGPAITFVLRHVGGPERSLGARTGVGMAFIDDGLRALTALAENHYRATDELVGRLGLGEDVRASLRQTHELRDASRRVALCGGDEIGASEPTVPERGGSTCCSSLGRSTAISPSALFSSHATSSASNPDVPFAAAAITICSNGSCSIVCLNAWR
jgi:hypothetical protein